MKTRIGISCLVVAGSLISTQALADAGAQDMIQEEMYLEGKTDIAPPSGEPPSTSLGVSPEVVREQLAVEEVYGVDSVTTEQGESGKVVSETDKFEPGWQFERESIVQAQLSSAEQPTASSSAMDEQRAQLEEERSELERQRADLEEQQSQLDEQMAQSETQAQPSGSQQVIWGEGQQASVNVPPPVTAEMVRELQQNLQAQGHNPGPIDGIWGPETHQALSEYQQQQGLEGGGQLDTQTLSSLDIGEPATRQRAALEQ